MSVDRYTKIVLTVIAVCFVWIAFGPVTRVPAAYAAGAPQGGPVDVNIVAVRGRRISREEGLPVTVENLPLMVMVLTP